MAGTGYKLFVNGNTLSASDLNTYLQQQTVMVFADSTARTTALSGVVSAGMISYLTGTNSLETYNGSTWTANGTGDVTTTGTQTLTNKTLTSPIINLGINAQTGTTYTTVLGDNGQLVTLNNASAITVSIPTNASVAYPIGAQINFAWITGAGQPTISATTPGTTTILSTGASSVAPKLRAVNATATCMKILTDTWIVAGDIV
jgi:hypothetical protein